ncbi:MAG: PD-(D/E)XK nuclease family protein [Candidatus Levyibacteriota bacterium]
MAPIYKLSPSDFAYLWNDCKHCYYQKVKLGVVYSSPFPAMFGRINALLQTSIMGMNLRDVHPDLPSGIIEIQEGFMRSKPIPGTNVYLSGRFDILTKLEDGTYAIIDFKITTPDMEKILKKYSSQLHAYKYALENPADGKAPIKISKMGAVSINPEEMKLVNGKVVFTAVPAWHPIEEDMDSFLGLIKEISEVLNGELPPESETCTLCIYRKNFEVDSNQTPDIPF